MTQSQCFKNPSTVKGMRRQMVRTSSPATVAQPMLSMNLTDNLSQVNNGQDPINARVEQTFQQNIAQSTLSSPPVTIHEAKQFKSKVPPYVYHALPDMLASSGLPPRRNIQSPPVRQSRVGWIAGMASDAGVVRQRKQTRTNLMQLKALNALFAKKQYPTHNERVQLGKNIGMEQRQIQNWFQNARQRTKYQASDAAFGSRSHRAATQEIAHSKSHTCRLQNPSANFYACEDMPSYDSPEECDVERAYPVPVCHHRQIRAAVEQEILLGSKVMQISQVPPQSRGGPCARTATCVATSSDRRTDHFTPHSPLSMPVQVHPTALPSEIPKDVALQNIDDADANNHGTQWHINSDYVHMFLVSASMPTGWIPPDGMMSDNVGFESHPLPPFDPEQHSSDFQSIRLIDSGRHETFL